MIKELLGKLFSQATKDYIFREIKHTGAAIVLVVVISVGTEMSGITDFENVAWGGMVANASRAGFTMLVLGAKRLLSALKEPSYNEFEV